MKKKYPSKKTKEKLEKYFEMQDVAVNVLFELTEYRNKKEEWDNSKYESEKTKNVTKIMPLLMALPLIEGDDIPAILNALCGSALHYKTQTSEYGYAPALYLIRQFVDRDGEFDVIEKKPDLAFLERTGLIDSLDEVMNTGTLEIKIDLKNHSNDRILWEMEELLKCINRIRKMLEDENRQVYTEPPRLTDPEKIYQWLHAWKLWKPRSESGERLTDSEIVKKLFPDVCDKEKLESLRKSVSNWFSTIEDILAFLRFNELERKSPFFLLRKPPEK
jgi:hypothetical protein